MTVHRLLRITVLFLSIISGLSATGCSTFSPRAATESSDKSAQLTNNPVRQSPEAIGVVQQNMYETMESNYVTLFETFDDVQKITLVFEDDSMRLGRDNKATINEYVAQMDPNTDVLSVIGCSHGSTRINNGNSLLALGRASRVKEAFLFAGLNHDQILEEGCWAPEAFDVMPSRGVVLTLKRKKT